MIPMPGLKNGGITVECSFVGRLDAGSTHALILIYNECRIRLFHMGCRMSMTSGLSLMDVSEGMLELWALKH